MFKGLLRLLVVSTMMGLFIHKGKLRGSHLLGHSRLFASHGLIFSHRVGWDEFFRFLKVKNHRN